MLKLKHLGKMENTNYFVLLTQRSLPHLLLMKTTLRTLNKMTKSHTYHIYIVMSHNMFTTRVVYHEMEGMVVEFKARKAAKPVDVVLDSFLTFSSMMPLDIFKETVGQFPAMFLATEVNILQYVGLSSE